MRVTLLRPILIAERRYDEGVTINVSPEVGSPLIGAGVARDADAQSGQERGTHDRNQKRKP